MRRLMGPKGTVPRHLALLAALGLVIAGCGDGDFAGGNGDADDSIEDDADVEDDSAADDDDGEEAAEEVDVDEAPMSDPPEIDCDPIEEELGEHTINFGIGLAANSPQGVAVQYFSDYVEECTGGQLTVELFPDSQIGDDLEMMDGLQTGTLEMTFPSSSPAVDTVPELGVFDLPFLMPDAETADEVLDGEVGDRLLAEFEGTGLKALNWAENGFRQVTNNVGPIESPEDMEGMTLRVMENEIHVDMWETLGASPTAMAFGEVFSALEQGVIDGQENPWVTNVTSNFWEVADYGSETRHVYTPFIMMISEDFYNDLPQEYQGVIDDASEEAKHYQRTVSREMDEWAREEFEALGAEVNVLDEDQLQEFVDATEDVYDTWAPEIGEDLVNDVLEITEGS